MTSRPFAWAMAPGPPARPRSSWASAIRMLLALAITGAGPVLWTASGDTMSTGVAAGASLVAGGAGLSARRRPACGRAAIVLAGLAATPSLGGGVAAWIMVNAAVAWWVTQDVPPLPGLPSTRPDALPGVVALSLISAVLAKVDHEAARVAAPVALAALMPLITRLGNGALGRLAGWLGDRAASLVSTLTFGLLGVVALLLPWIARKPLGLDPLREGSLGGWTARRRRDAQANRPWSASADLAGRPSGRRWRPTAMALAALIVLVAASPPGQRAWRRDGHASNPFRLEGGSGGDLSQANIRDRVPDDLEAHEPGPDDEQAAMLSSPWFYGSNFLEEAQDWALNPLNPRNAWRPVNPYRHLDFRSTLYNVVDGARLSWTPPPCADCTTLTVWIYGGSTTYGLNQRDEYTIASYLARVAARDGVRLEIHNRGSNGHLHWLEAERFAWDLTVDDPPDMVLFYDGVNESWAGGAMNGRGGYTLDAMVDPTLEDLWDTSRRSDGPVPQGPEGSEFIGPVAGPLLEIGALERMVMDRYDQSRELSRTTAAAHRTPVRYFWQPSRFSRPLVLSEPHADGPLENRSRLSDQLSQSYLADDVIDLTGSLRSTTEPLFTDDVHHNETGARLVAEAMYASIRTDLRALSDQKEAAR